jgi:hypothetical protein
MLYVAFNNTLLFNRKEKNNALAKSALRVLAVYADYCMHRFLTRQGKDQIQTSYRVGTTLSYAVQYHRLHTRKQALQEKTVE